MCNLVELHTNFNTSVMVAENKADTIMFIIENASKCPKIDAILLFGSALAENCKEVSDIDLAIISNNSLGSLCRTKSFNSFMEGLYLRNMSQDYDCLYFKSLDEIAAHKDKAPIYNELLDKGKVIYKKQIA